MKIWKISQTVNSGYDTYDSAIVAAKNEDDARKMAVGDTRYTWCAPEYVTVELIGTATRGSKSGIILASFNAG